MRLCRVPENKVLGSLDFRAGASRLGMASEKNPLNYLSTSQNSDPRRLMRQTAFCDPQTLSILRFSKAVFLPAN